MNIEGECFAEMSLVDIAGLRNDGKKEGCHGAQEELHRVLRGPDNVRNVNWEVA